MRNFFGKVAQVFIFFFTSLRPFVLVAVVFAILAVSLYVYDQYRTYQERSLGAKLIDRIDIKPLCDELINPNDKFSFKFTIQNKNSQNVVLKEIGIDINLLGVNGKKFSEFIDSTPKSEIVTGGSPQYQSIAYQTPLDVQKKSNESISLNFKSLSKKDSGATSHTIVSYSGKVIFLFDHEITIETKCQFQVRYP